jgi:hypothetical protein
MTNGENKTGQLQNLGLSKGILFITYNRTLMTYFT